MLAERDRDGLGAPMNKRPTAAPRYRSAAE